MADSSTLDPNDLRLAANGHFANNSFDEALSLYSLAVEIARTRLDEHAQEEQEQSDNNDCVPTTDDHPRAPDLVIHLCNRSACLHKMEMYDDACADAAEAVRLCSSSSGAEGGNAMVNQLLKSLYRLARAQIASKDYSSALNTIDTATSRCEHLLQGDEGVDTESSEEQLQLQLKEFTKLRSIAYKERKLADANPDPSSPQDNSIQSIKLESRTPSIREFTRPSKSSDNYRPLGEGNFSTVVICSHKSTNETFALKIIKKEECKKLAKRQHPNVFNEVAMERRILTQHRLPWHVNIIQCYHAMQDYGNLYFLMQLHQEHGDLWSKIRYKNCMVGCHSSLIRPYFYELLSAIEHCHNHGIVHRDLKPENVLLNEQGGHVILIDFGTAKDLIVTDLNGPEFVGTPDFMSPEAVKEGKGEGSNGCDFTADLWSLGVILYQLYAGALPFESQSPYLGFLKIQRGIYAGRNMGVWDDDAWDLIQKLLQVNSKERIGAGCFEWVPPPIIDGTDAKDTIDSGNKRIDEEKEWVEKVENIVAISSPKKRPIGKILEHGSGYDIIRQHTFLAKHQFLNITNSHLRSDSDVSSVPQPIPSLQDLAIRATAHFIDQSSLAIDLEDLHPPGDNSSYDTLRLKPTDRRRVIHLLDRLHLLREPRIYRRFFHSKQDAQLGRIRPESRDVIGLTQMNDKMGQPRGKNPDEPHPDLQVPASKLVGMSRTRIHHITNPLFSRTINDRCNNNDEQRKVYIKQLKESLRLVNRVRPNVVVACGYFDDACRKLLSKINETIPVILHDGTSFFSFWIYGAHCLAMPIKHLQGKSGELDVTQKREALAWFRMELEQIKTARSHGYVFLDGDARDISQEWMSYIGKRHVLGLIGTHKEVPFVSGAVDLHFETQFSVAKFQTDVTAGNPDMDVQENEDVLSISSSDSGNSDDGHVMHIVGRLENGVRCIVIGEEDLVWNGEFLL